MRPLSTRIAHRALAVCVGLCVALMLAAIVTATARASTSSAPDPYSVPVALIAAPDITIPAGTTIKLPYTVNVDTTTVATGTSFTIAASGNPDDLTVTPEHTTVTTDATGLADARIDVIAPLDAPAGPRLITVTMTAADGTVYTATSVVTIGQQTAVLGAAAAPTPAAKTPTKKPSLSYLLLSTAKAHSCSFLAKNRTCIVAHGSHQALSGALTVVPLGVKTTLQLSVIRRGATCTNATSAAFSKHGAFSKHAVARSKCQKANTVWHTVHLGTQNKTSYKYLWTQVLSVLPRGNYLVSARVSAGPKYRNVSLGLPLSMQVK